MFVEFFIPLESHWPYLELGTQHVPVDGWWGVWAWEKSWPSKEKKVDDCLHLPPKAGILANPISAFMVSGGCPRGPTIRPPEAAGRQEYPVLRSRVSHQERAKAWLGNDKQKGAK